MISLLFQWAKVGVNHREIALFRPFYDNFNKNGEHHLKFVGK